MSEMEVTEGQLLSQDFGIGGPPATAEAPLPPVDSGKTPDILAAEIRTIKDQTGRMVLNASIEVGRRLTEAKAKLPHGSWGEYLKNEVDYSPSQAQNLMRVFREYGSDQQSLFGGEAKSQTFGRLTFSQALSLLVIPDEDEREKFVLENDVEHMSVRELNEALKARDEAEEKAAAAEETARGLQQEAQRLQDALSEANTSAQAAEESLEAAQKELAERKAKGPEVRELTQEEKDALTAEAVERIKAENAERMQALEKQLSKADPDTATFKVLFSSWQETYWKMMEVLERIKAADSTKAGKLQGAVRAAVEGMA
ncbi:MAG: DUF3102 domain-containing protein [Oscillospiraceae bacterium]|jgi:DNA repair exonuclease SbcCD ATPase subunit|nr:DUF3102 domain-containing protein [Oscillospiraceae bacterium]